ncbi:hypothetical protein LCGC14_2506370 [marine sediment metagenome]|uniref:Uncharacterized protein n=1 Tax=marine sediment metagenome TaxID=412755 RepID=A0A0F9B0F2_9ZZZZ
MPWEYHKDVIEALSLFPDLILFKARQLGWTWLLSGWGDWKITVNSAVKGLYLSQGEKEAWAMIAKTRYIHTNLPDFLRLKEKHAIKYNAVINKVGEVSSREISHSNTFRLRGDLIIVLSQNLAVLNQHIGFVLYPQHSDL